jgi:hypothetical protein
MLLCCVVLKLNSNKVVVVIQNPGSISSIPYKFQSFGQNPDASIWVEIDFPLFRDFQHKLTKLKHKISENCLQILEIYFAISIGS